MQDDIGITYDLIKRFIILGCTLSDAVVMTKYCMETGNKVVIKTDGVEDIQITDDSIDQYLIKYIIDPYYEDIDDEDFLKF